MGACLWEGLPFTRLLILVWDKASSAGIVCEVLVLCGWPYNIVRGNVLIFRKIIFFT